MQRPSESLLVSGGQAQVDGLEKEERDHLLDDAAAHGEEDGDDDIYSNYMCAILLPPSVASAEHARAAEHAGLQCADRVVVLMMPLKMCSTFVASGSALATAA